jgi:hypothetical protein
MVSADPDVSQPAPYPTKKPGRPKGPTGEDYRLETIKRRCEFILQMHKRLAERTGEPVDCAKVLEGVAKNLARFPPSAQKEAKLLKDIIQGRISEADWPEEDRKLWAKGELKQWAEKELKKIPRFSRYKAGKPKEKPKWTKRELGRLVDKAMNTSGKFRYIDKAAKRLKMSEAELKSMWAEAKRLGLKTNIGEDNSGREFLMRD